MRAARQLTLESRVLWEITVKKHGRGIYMSTIAGNAFGHRRAALEMARITAANHPGSRISFRRLPMDGVPCRLCGSAIVIPDPHDPSIRGALCGKCR